MNPILNFKKLTFSQIDFDDVSYSISLDLDIVPDEKLNSSISRHGILRPPIVKEIDSDYFKIVAGRKRLLAYWSLHPTNTCACLTISPQIAEVDVFSIMLEEKQLSRDLTTIEKAIFLHKITSVADEEKVIREFLPRLGLSPDSFSMQKTLKLLDFEDSILYGIHKGQINETVAHDFILLSPQDRMVLFKIIVNLRLSFSFQKKLLNICLELANRNNISIATLLDNDEVHNILQHQNANPPQKTKNLMLWLSRKHMPRYSQAAEEFRCFITAMQLPQNVSVAHTPSFEDESMTLSIIYPNRKSLQNAWEKIREATDDNDN
jgi:ParB family chromosome partitioning protein